ncbi:TIGR02234 family membrane protein [Actinoallomurus bryophytorum]|uniref:Putative membrane protein (TIGR02234 family) n=1 Tax=Actinoallomurus bryophytorum TaxID=1490222 RepID=A0A543C1Y4_9ACTN|nr:Trp biosynthesis-associated membrane protein [Actinoallomurus bryophytorum]TQL91046.1 putative membrane protein (TIGR02234 family) [Actinoallomurus bryophytorum]
MTSRRELAAATLLGGAGAAIVVGFAGRSWATVTERGTGVETLNQHLSGRSLSGVIAALGWAGLAGIAALLATRGWARVAVGVLLAAFGVIVAIASPGAVRHAHVASIAGDKTNLARLGGDLVVHVNAWWTLSLAGGVLLAAAGLLTTVRGRRWPGMSSRYERPSAAQPSTDDPASLWKALDRGDDPT